MTTYPLDTIKMTATFVVALKFVESMKYMEDQESEVINALKGDVILNIRTISGAEYSVSMLSLKNLLPFKDNIESLEALRDAVYNRWIHIIRKS